jgi:hypothetical protein
MIPKTRFDDRHDRVDYLKACEIALPFTPALPMPRVWPRCFGRGYPTPHQRPRNWSAGCPA